jgi:hypothetical protein
MGATGSIAERVVNQVAIVIVAIGEPHLSYWKRHCEASCRAYASKCGYDLIPITQPQDHSAKAQARSPAWQKCLVPGLGLVSQYRQIVIMDCDIVINVAAAPPITDQVAPEHIGAIISGSHLQEDMRAVLISRLDRHSGPYTPSARLWQDDQARFYTRYGLPPHDAGIVQTGVMVASPKHHRELFEATYHKDWSDNSRTLEQVPLSHGFLTTGVFRQIDVRFNSVFYETMLVHYPYLTNLQTPSYDDLATAAVQTEFANNFFLHFAYAPDMAEFLTAPRA